MFGKQKRLGLRNLPLVRACKFLLAQADDKYPTFARHVDFAEKILRAQRSFLCKEERLQGTRERRKRNAVDKALWLVVLFTD